jgi:hypothetical protein
MAIGWRTLSMLTAAYGLRRAFNTWNAQTYGPLLGAYHRKYDKVAATDLFEITDRKREYYEIDDS